jgi:hypothetical protein
MSACLMCCGGSLRSSTAPTVCIHHHETVLRSKLRRCGLLRPTQNPLPRTAALLSGQLLVRARPSAASWLEEAYRRLVLRDHVQFVAQALASSTARGRCWT